MVGTFWIGHSEGDILVRTFWSGYLGQDIMACPFIIFSAGIKIGCWERGLAAKKGEMWGNFPKRRIRSILAKNVHYNSKLQKISTKRTANCKNSRQNNSKLQRISTKRTVNCKKYPPKE